MQSWPAGRVRIVPSPSTCLLLSCTRPCSPFQKWMPAAVAQPSLAAAFAHGSPQQVPLSGQATADTCAMQVVGTDLNPDGQAACCPHPNIQKYWILKAEAAAQVSIHLDKMSIALTYRLVRTEAAAQVIGIDLDSDEEPQPSAATQTKPSQSSRLTLGGRKLPSSLSQAATASQHGRKGLVRR